MGAPKDLLHCSVVISPGWGIPLGLVTGVNGGQGKVLFPSSDAQRMFEKEVLKRQGWLAAIRSVGWGIPDWSTKFGDLLGHSCCWGGPCGQVSCSGSHSGI